MGDRDYRQIALGVLQLVPNTPYTNPSLSSRTISEDIEPKVLLTDRD